MDERLPEAVLVAEEAALTDVLAVVADDDQNRLGPLAGLAKRLAQPGEVSVADSTEARLADLGYL